MAFLLSGAPYHYNDLTIGMFGLVGAAGALCANFAGRWADRRWTKSTSLVFSSLMALSFAPLWWGRHSLTMLIVGILLLDVGVQGLQVTNQSLIYRLARKSRVRGVPVARCVRDRCGDRSRGNNHRCRRLFEQDAPPVTPHGDLTSTN